MLRCRELSKLPKVQGQKSVTFRRQTPGSVSNFLGPPGGYPNYVDPTHPATKVPKRQFPAFKRDALSIKAIPFAVLAKPEQVWPNGLSPIELGVGVDSWKERVERSIAGETRAESNGEEAEKEESFVLQPMKLLGKERKDRVPMSLMNATSKKRTSNKRHIRHKIASRMKVAINLIVTRGANTITVDGKQKMVMNDYGEVREMKDRWIYPGWTYIFFPTLEIYRMPYRDMIPMLRDALQSLWEQAKAMETNWETQAQVMNQAQAAGSKDTSLGPNRRGQNLKHSVGS